MNDDVRDEPSGPKPPLEGRRVVLRHTSPRDYDYLFQLGTTTENGTLWRYRGATPAPENFTRSLWDDVLCMFTIFRAGTPTPTPVGLVYAYRADFRSDFVYMALILEHTRDRPLLAHDTVLLFVNYVFTCWPFRKIYGETSERNMQRFRSAAARLFEEEGRLKNHEYFGGRYWDHVMTALYREAWAERAAKLLPRVLVPENELASAAR